MKNIDLDAAKVYWKCKGRLPAKIGSCPKSVNCCIECSDNAALVGMAFYKAWVLAKKYVDDNVRPRNGKKMSEVIATRCGLPIDTEDK